MRLRPIHLNSPSLTTTLITTKSNMCGETYSLALKILSTNGVRKKLPNTIPYNVTLPLKTSHPSQRLTCILNKFHYTNSHNYIPNSLLMSIL